MYRDGFDKMSNCFPPKTFWQRRSINIGTKMVARHCGIEEISRASVVRSRGNSKVGSYVLSVLVFFFCSQTLAGEVSGRVWIVNRGAAANAVVNFRRDNKGNTFTATTNGDGDYSTSLAAGNYVTWVKFGSLNSSKMWLKVPASEMNANLDLRERNGSYSITRR